MFRQGSTQWREIIMQNHDSWRTDGAEAVCVADRPAKLEEATYELVRIIEATLMPCRDVKVRRNRETSKRKGIRARGFLKPGVKSDKMRGKQWINRKEMRSRRCSGAEDRHGGYAGKRRGSSDSQAWEGLRKGFLSNVEQFEHWEQWDGKSWGASHP